MIDHAQDMQYIATICFGLAVVQTFFARPIRNLGSRYPEGSFAENAFHLLGEVEVVFGLWTGVFFGFWSVFYGSDSAAHFLQEINYTEAGFVFVVMCMAATRPVLWLANTALDFLTERLEKITPLSYGLRLYLVALILGPLLGSLITEPAAMTVVALLLREKILQQTKNERFLYATLGLLFVNVSIGGTLTHFAAPPVVMVARPWNWSTAFMFINFGWRATIAIFLSTGLVAWWFKGELREIKKIEKDAAQKQIPHWVVGVHLIFLAAIIFHSHYLAFCVGAFFFFLGWCTVSREYQDELRIKESLLVGFFLAGLVSLGHFQEWWLHPLLSRLDSLQLFWGAVALTAVTDNAALTYLGTLVPDLADPMKRALVSGAVVGGGLTVIANAPNPVGYSLLGSLFGADGIRAGGLFLGALLPTAIAALCFLL